MALSAKEIASIESSREWDLNPPPGYTPILELWGRKRRLEGGRIIAEEQGVDLPDPGPELTTQLFNIYYDALLAGTHDASELDKTVRDNIKSQPRSNISPTDITFRRPR